MKVLSICLRFLIEFAFQKMAKIMIGMEAGVAKVFDYCIAKMFVPLVPTFLIEAFITLKFAEDQCFSFLLGFNLQCQLIQTP